MSVKEQMGYAIVCDFPGCGTETGDLGDYAFWGDVGAAVDEWSNADGYSGDLGDYCEEHTVWVSCEGDDGIEERAPMLPTLANLFALADRRAARRIELAERRALMRLGDLGRKFAGDAAARDRAARRHLAALGVQVPA